MATSGTITKVFSSKGYFRLRAVWSASGQNVTNNTTNVSVTLYLDSLSGYASISDATNSATSITINGNTKSWSTTSSVGANGTKNLGSHSVTIGHNSDGTKTFSFSVAHTVDITYSGSYIGNVSVSGTGTLDTIARKSTVSLNKASTDIGTVVRISINRASGSFTHKLTYSWGSSNGVIAERISWTEHDWTVPTSFYSVIPNSTSGWGTITCETFNGSTSLGTNSVKLTTTIPSNIVPSIGSLSAVEANTTVTGKVAMGANTFIQGMSQVKLTMGSISAGTGATISSYRFNFDNYDQYGATTKTFPNPAESGTKTVTAYVTDSRGRTASRTLNVTLVPYSSPTLSTVSAKRSDGGTGNKVTVVRSGNIASLSGKNSYSLTVRYKEKSSTTYLNDANSSAGGSAGTTTFNLTNVMAPVFDITKTYDILVQVNDLFNSISSAVTVSTAAALVDLGIKGVALGKIYDESVGGALQIGGGVIVDEYIAEKIPANANLNNYTKPGTYYCPSDADAVTISNTPSNKSFSLQVLRHSGYRQIFSIYTTAIPLTYERNFYNGSWGRWLLTSGNEGNALTMNNGWSYYGGQYLAPQFWLDASDMVHLGGMIDYGSQTAGVQLATIPVGFRPASREIFTGFAYGNNALRIDVTSAGEVLAMEKPSGFISLSGIKFRRNWYY